MTNLPDKNRKADIIGVVGPAPDYVRPETVNFSIKICRRDPTESADYIICEIEAATLQGIADSIAKAVREARDIGFEQGREYVRRALGIKDC